MNKCPICIDEEYVDESHLSTELHRFNYILQLYNLNRRALSQNKHGVELDVKVKSINGFTYDFNQVHNKKGNHTLNLTPEMFKQHKNEISFICTLKNKRTRKEDPIVITNAVILHPYPVFSMTFLNNNETVFEAKKIEVNETYTVEIKLKLENNDISDFKMPFCFSFQTMTRTEKMIDFNIARCTVIAICNDVQKEPIFERSPFSNNRWEPVPVRPAKKRFRGPDNFPIPAKYWKTLFEELQNNDDVLSDILAKLRPGLEENYEEFLHILLWLEEACCVKGLSCYNMENANLKYLEGKVLQLQVPGLAEKRPSVIKGDLIEIKVHNDHLAYQGVIQNVGDKTVDIYNLDDEIIEAIRIEPDLEMDVRFILGRIDFERMHQGVEYVARNGYVKNLFPKPQLALRVPSPKLNINKFFNKCISENNEQAIAVNKIINNTVNNFSGAPYIVYGPPGTGKTITIIEAILQLKKHTNLQILFCAPSNAACNMVTEKLAEHCTTNELKRVVSQTFDKNIISPNILNYCNIIEVDGVREIVPFGIDQLKKYRIIVTTLILAGKYNGYYQPNVVFIDEAAQAIEPEACCAIALLVGTKNQLVLAGDPKQLGPIVHSKICTKEYKLDISLLERLIDTPLYQEDLENHKYNFITMLKRNYRSHAEILEIPNKLFYENSLVPMSEQAFIDPIARLSIKTNQPGRAIEFYNVMSKERREGKSPSYYNPREVEVTVNCIKILCSLKLDKPHIVTADQIGVVTPYIRQMYKIRNALKENYPGVEVGTTEAFQGREKRVIIISSVRAQKDLLLYDKKYKLGFVSEPKRFNVAITRAKSKVILIGNQNVLTTDQCWREYIELCKSYNTFFGAPYQVRDRRTRQSIISKFSTMTKKDCQNNETR